MFLIQPLNMGNDRSIYPIKKAPLEINPRKCPLFTRTKIYKLLTCPHFTDLTLGILQNCQRLKPDSFLPLYLPDKRNIRSAEVIPPKNEDNPIRAYEAIYQP